MHERLVCIQVVTDGSAKAFLEEKYVQTDGSYFKRRVASGPVDEIKIEARTRVGESGKHVAYGELRIKKV